MKEHGIALLLVTHRREEAEQLCQRICTLSPEGCSQNRTRGLRMSVATDIGGDAVPCETHKLFDWLVEGPATAGSRLTDLLDLHLHDAVSVIVECGIDESVVSK